MSQSTACALSTRAPERPAGRNNATGGILLEEGTRDFTVTRCDLRNVRGNGIWTHSLATAPQNRDGLIASNHFERIGRDAIQVGHGTRVRVEDNTGSEIGYPLEDVDMEDLATPVAIDTAGDTIAFGIRAQSILRSERKMPGPRRLSRRQSSRQHMHQPSAAPNIIPTETWASCSTTVTLQCVRKESSLRTTRWMAVCSAAYL